MSLDLDLRTLETSVPTSKCVSDKQNRKCVFDKRIILVYNDYLSGKRENIRRKANKIFKAFCDVF